MSNIEPTPEKINKYLDLVEECPIPRESPAFPMRVAESSQFGKASKAWSDLFKK